MPLPDYVRDKWAYREHTRVKHEILKNYLTGWLKILGRKYPCIRFFDCFAGRGVYEGNEEGSPLLALSVAAQVKTDFAYLREIVLYFIEKNRDNYLNLRRAVDEKVRTEQEKYRDIRVEYRNDEFGNVASRLRQELGKNLAPALFFVDPFGWSGIPFYVMKGLLSIPHVEVFITFMIRDVQRFLTSETHRRSIEELYGLENVLQQLATRFPNEPQEVALLKLYRFQLHSEAEVEYTFPFRVNADQRLQTTYYLIHATNHPLGCELMKDVMFKQGTPGRFGYFGPAEGQLTLDHYSEISQLKDLLLERFRGRKMEYLDIIQKTLMDTTSIRKHYRRAILELEADHKVVISNRGPRGGLLDNSCIAFQS